VVGCQWLVIELEHDIDTRLRLAGCA